MPFFCYLLYTDQGHTYVGATVDLDRRLQQHNRIQSGGAHATGIRVAQGYEWKRACSIQGIPDWQSALQLEWRWKQLGRTRHKGIKNPLLRRLHSLHSLLSLEKPTEKAISYEMYPEGPPYIVWDSDGIEAQYDSLFSSTGTSSSDVSSFSPCDTDSFVIEDISNPSSRADLEK